jgi:hypothetical protein
MNFIYADSLDYIDPAYDFEADRNPPGRRPYWDDLYPHEFMDSPPYNGVLVSRAIVGDGKVRGGKYTEAQAMRLRRAGARTFRRLNCSFCIDAYLRLLRRIRLPSRRRSPVHARKHA